MPPIRVCVTAAARPVFSKNGFYNTSRVETGLEWFKGEEMETAVCRVLRMVVHKKKAQLKGEAENKSRCV